MNIIPKKECSDGRNFCKYGKIQYDEDRVSFICTNKKRTKKVEIPITVIDSNSRIGYYITDDTSEFKPCPLLK
jgi:hypothetical protein